MRRSLSHATYPSHKRLLHAVWRLPAPPCFRPEQRWGLPACSHTSHVSFPKPSSIPEINETHRLVSPTAALLALSLFAHPQAAHTPAAITAPWTVRQSKEGLQKVRWIQRVSNDSRRQVVWTLTNSRRSAASHLGADTSQGTFGIT